MPQLGLEFSRPVLLVRGDLLLACGAALRVAVGFWIDGLFSLGSMPSVGALFDWPPIVDFHEIEHPPLHEPVVFDSLHLQILSVDGLLFFGFLSPLPHLLLIVLLQGSLMVDLPAPNPLLLHLDCLQLSIDRPIEPSM
jgi:hypothetical protein